MGRRGLIWAGGETTVTRAANVVGSVVVVVFANKALTVRFAGVGTSSNTLTRVLSACPRAQREEGKAGLRLKTIDNVADDRRQPRETRPKGRRGLLHPPLKNLVLGDDDAERTHLTGPRAEGEIRSNSTASS
ncbi:hypothetical protein LY78DRAFT_660216 [Colletotrichum sublineola]|nr:hypothetical protein LY78DRAFT_660216 [Colletotrichum sublineola]